MTDAFAIFTAIDTLVLERAPDRTFRCLGDPPAWCAELWPVCGKDAVNLAPELEFPFLEVFLAEAEEAWKHSSRIDSETWTRVDEHGVEVHLQATAIAVDGSEILMIGRCDTLHRARQLLLQRARELRLAHDLAGRAAEQKDVLVHYIVHDLQGPLSTIRHTLRRLDEELTSPSLAQLVSVARDAAEKQRDLILDILEMFAAEQTAPGTTQAVHAISAIVARYEPVARARGLSLERETHHGELDKVSVVGDAHRLERVLSNLLEASIRGAQSSVSVRVRPSGKEVFICIDNDGAFSRDQIDDLFARPGGEGGIGLYFCRITIERWGGRIGCDARRHGGTTMWLRLPIAT